MARLKVNLLAREFEIEGSEAFVEAYGGRIEQLLHRLVESARAGAETPTTAVEAPAGTPADEGFGGLLLALPRNATDVDRILLAGWYVQQAAPERTFTTAEANRHLVEQGIKVGNASQSVKQNLVAKRAFLVQRGRYRVAHSGLAHLAQLTAGRVAPTPHGPA